MKENNIKKRWLYLLMGVITMLFAGVLYAWSILKTPLAENFGWTVNQLALNFTLTMCFFCLGGFFGSLAAKKLGARTIICTGAIMAGAGFTLTSRLDGSSVVLMYLSYGLLAGYGIGSAYVVLVSTVSGWFPDKKGLCSGLLMMGFGSSTLLLGNVSVKLMDCVGWRRSYLILGLAIGLVIFLAGLVVQAPGADTVLPQSNKKKKTCEVFEPKDYTTAQMIRRFSFWRAFICIVFMAAVGNTVVSFARDLAISVGASVSTATMLVGILSVCNGMGRIIVGALFDGAGRRFSMIAANLVTILAAAITLAAVSLHSLPLCILGICLTGVSFGSCPTFSSAFTSAFYGTKNFSTNFSVMNFNIMGASLISMGANALLTSYGSYSAPFILLLVLAVMGLILNLSVNRP